MNLCKRNELIIFGPLLTIFKVSNNIGVLGTTTIDNYLKPNQINLSLSKSLIHIVKVFLFGSVELREIEF